MLSEQKKNLSAIELITTKGRASLLHTDWNGTIKEFHAAVLDNLNGVGY
jgi:hypothetical protein